MKPSRLKSLLTDLGKVSGRKNNFGIKWLKDIYKQHKKGIHTSLKVAGVAAVAGGAAYSLHKHNKSKKEKLEKESKELNEKEAKLINKEVAIKLSNENSKLPIEDKKELKKTEQELKKVEQEINKEQPVRKIELKQQENLTQLKAKRVELKRKINEKYEKLKKQNLNISPELKLGKELLIKIEKFKIDILNYNNSIIGLIELYNNNKTILYNENKLYINNYNNIYNKNCTKYKCNEIIEILNEINLERGKITEIFEKQRIILEEEKEMENYYKYYIYLTALYYTDYEKDDNLRSQFQFFYTFIFQNYLKLKYHNLGDINTISATRLIEFLDKNKEHCIIQGQTININNYQHDTVNIELPDRQKFEDGIQNCVNNNSLNTTGFIHLEDKNIKDHALHRNTFILSKKDKKFWRLEPNFNIEWEPEQIREKYKDFEHTDHLQVGQYDINDYVNNVGPYCKGDTYKDRTFTVEGQQLNFHQYCKKEYKKYNQYANKALHDYFKEKPLVINGITYEFDGFYPYALKSCPNHGGLCEFVSTLQTQIPKNITFKNIKYYVIKYLEWEYFQIFKEKFDINLNTNEKLTDLISYIKKHYSTPQTIIKVNDKKYENGVLSDAIKSIEINNTSVKLRFTSNTTGKLLFTKPPDYYSLPMDKHTNFGKKVKKTKKTKKIKN